MGICGYGRNGQSWWRMSSKTGQDFWLDQLEIMGGQFWPPSPEEKEAAMPVVGAKYPMMLYNGNMEVIVHDDEEYKEAHGHGFKELHPAEPAPRAAQPPPPRPEPKPAPPPPPPPAAASRPEPKAQVTVEKKVTVTPPSKSPISKK